MSASECGINIIIQEKLLSFNKINYAFRIVGRRNLRIGVAIKSYNFFISKIDSNNIEFKYGI